jgi:hypothetical protein
MSDRNPPADVSFECRKKQTGWRASAEDGFSYRQPARNKSTGDENLRVGIDCWPRTAHEETN